MLELDVNQIIERLTELQAYSPVLARRTEHEKHLPENPAPWFVMKIERAFSRCENASVAERADAFQELEEWLRKSHRYFLERLISSGIPWVFRFPKSMSCTHAPVYTHQ
jgi:hypothetical protein